MIYLELGTRARAIDLAKRRSKLPSSHLGGVRYTEMGILEEAIRLGLNEIEKEIVIEEDLKELPF